MSSIVPAVDWQDVRPWQQWFPHNERVPAHGQDPWRGGLSVRSDTDRPRTAGPACARWQHVNFVDDSRNTVRKKTTNAATFVDLVFCCAPSGCPHCSRFRPRSARVSRHLPTMARSITRSCTSRSWQARNDVRTPVCQRVSDVPHLGPSSYVLRLK